MDPYLESPDLWGDVHNRLLAALADELGEVLRPRYYARLEERTYLVEPDGLLLVGRPDLTITTRESTENRPAGPERSRLLTVEVPVPDRVRETYLEVRLSGSGEVVTVLELLSPTNKRPGEGRRLYERKRLETLGTRTSLVEVDLLRGGEPMPVKGQDPTGDYRILVCRGEQRPRASLSLFGLRDPIPRFRLPLRGEEGEPEVDLGELLHRLYDRAAYDLSIDYEGEPTPPLSEIDWPWVDRLLRGAGLRRNST